MSYKIKYNVGDKIMFAEKFANLTDEQNKKFLKEMEVFSIQMYNTDYMYELKTEKGETIKVGSSEEKYMFENEEEFVKHLFKQTKLSLKEEDKKETNYKMMINNEMKYVTLNYKLSKKNILKLEMYLNKYNNSLEEAKELLKYFGIQIKELEIEETCLCEKRETENA